MDQSVKETAPPRAPADRKPRRRPRRLRWLLALGAILVLGFIVYQGISERHAAVAAMADVANESAVPTVMLTSPKPGAASRTLTLPGDVSAWYSAPIFAQVTGYVTMWYRDYGASVHKGDLLATIETPDLDQELQQAQAQVEVAQTRYALAQQTAKRWQSLAGTQAVSQQSVDVNAAEARAQKAEVDAARFKVARFQAQEAFKRVVAPFDGVVTARHTDVGNFVNAAGGDASNNGRAQALFEVSDTHRMRIFVSVPQDFSGYLHPGLTATFGLPQYPGRIFKANFMTSARSYNTTSRTVLSELEVDNPRNEIWPGAYAEVHFTVPTRSGVLVVPEQALLFRAQGMQVALVGADNRVHLQNVKLGLNLGTTAQVIEGLKPDDRLVSNPSYGLLEGETVRVVDAPPQNADDEMPAKQPPEPTADE